MFLRGFSSAGKPQPIAILKPSFGTLPLSPAPQAPLFYNFAGAGRREQGLNSGR